MAKIYLALLFCCFAQFTFAQNNVGIGTNTPGEKLDVIGNIKADTLKPQAIYFPNGAAAGYVLSSDSFGNAFWQLPQNGGGSGNAWNLNGNAGTSLFSNFIGTTDAVGLRFRIYNIPAGELSDTTFFNTAFGFRSLMNNNSGANNLAFGSNTLYNNLSGSFNTGIGSFALYSNVLGEKNVAIGANTLYRNKASHNIGIGFASMYYDTSGTRNIAIGTNTLFFGQNPNRNIAVGFTAGQFVNGNDNTIVGDNAGQALSLGSRNVIIGNNAEVLEKNMAGAIGYGAYSNQDSVIALGNSGHKIAIARMTADEKLHVAGNVKIDSLSGSGNRVVFTDANGKLFDSVLSVGGGGSVTSITAGSGLSGGTITTSGTISLPNVGSAGTYGSGSQIPIITTDTKGRITAISTAAISASGGDNWGAQTAVSAAPLSGNGTPGNPLSLGQNGAGLNQVLKWDGVNWIAANDSVGAGADNWGTQSTVTDPSLSGNGTVSSPLKIAQQSAVNGQVLKWDGTSWSPANDNNSGADNWGAQTAVTDLTLSGNGTAASPLKIAQQGAVNGRVLKWNGSTWAPATDTWGTQSAQVNATLSGNGTAATPLGIAQQGATNGQVLKWNGTAWLPASDSVGTGSDNWGTQVAQTTTRLSGAGTSASPLDIAQQGATSGKVLKWNGTSWAPANDSVGSGADNWGTQVTQTNTTLSGNGTSASPLQIAQQGATSGQVLKWNGTAWIPQNENADTWGTQVVQTNVTLIGNGTIASPLQIGPQGALNGQVLKWNGIIWAPSSDSVGSGADNWGTQVAQTTARLSGAGTSASPLDIAQQGATSGKVLKWNGTSWAPANDSVGSGADNWGTQVAQTNTTLSGNGTSASPLQIAQQGATSGQVLKWNGTAWLPANDSASAITGAWSINGNSGTSSANFIGTTDNKNLFFKRNNVSAGLISDSNTAFGVNALATNSVGNNNSAFGEEALRFNTTGSDNNAFGTSALKNNTTGSQNNAFGGNALTANTTGTNNNAFGLGTLASNVSGFNNSAYGWGTLFYNTVGFGNSGFGHQALYSTSSGFNNTAVGASSMQYNTTGNYNAAFGTIALRNVSSGSFNSALGYNTLFTNTTGSFNTAIGDSADVLFDNLSKATAIGSNAKVGISNAVVLGDSSNAKIGIGTAYPTQKLDVRGTVRIVDGTQGSSKVLTSDANGNASWQTLPSSSGGSTLDAAYDFGGAGAGRIIIADSGAVQVAGEDGLLVTGTFGQGDTIRPVSVTGNTRMFFNPRKAAFRAGFNASPSWDNDSTGNYSFAVGNLTRAKGTYAAALGFGSIANGDASLAAGQNAQTYANQTIALGTSVVATGSTAITIGNSDSSIGSASITLGNQITARSAFEVVVGKDNTSYTPQSANSWNVNDRLFVVGNGVGSNKSDALTIIKKGDVIMDDSTFYLLDSLNRVGVNTKLPTTALDVNGQIRIRGGIPAAGKILQSDANGVGSWVPVTSIGASNSLDMAYDYGGQGLGRIITADSGAVTIQGEDGLLIKGLFGNGDDMTSALLGSGPRLFFNPKTAAFRAGYINNAGIWTAGNLGSNSFATGNNTLASGLSSFAANSGTHATALGATAFGDSTYSDGEFSFTMGQYSTVSAINGFAGGFYNSVTNTANNSAAFGSTNLVNGQNCLVAGINNTASAANSIVAGIGNIVGNGSLAAGSTNTINTNGIVAGSNNAVSGSSSASIGDYNNVVSNASLGVGVYNNVQSSNSTVTGSNNGSFAASSFVNGDSAQALSGFATFASGKNVNTYSYAESALGTYNTAYAPLGTAAISLADRLFVLGNGTSNSARSDAMIVYKSGNVQVDDSTFYVLDASNRVGIGTVSPSTTLDVNGTIRIRGGAPGAGKVLQSDALGNATWATAAGGGGTLDAAYDFGGAGLGRIITADAGAVLVQGSDGFQVTGTHGSGTNLALSGVGTRLFYYPKKSAFRAGSVSGAQWNVDSIGDYSSALGLSTVALGNSSFAAGYSSTARGNYAVALGYFGEAAGIGSFSVSGKAKGDYSVAFYDGVADNFGFAYGNTGTYAKNGFAFGTNDSANANSNNAFALGNGNKAVSNSGSIAMGYNTEARGDYSTAIGYFSKAYGNSSFATGGTATGSGSSSFGSGSNNFANGQNSAVFGSSNIANAYSGLVVGMNNDSLVSPETSGTNNTSAPLFIVGNGTSSSTRSNAFVVRKDANVSINHSSPNTNLDINGDLAYRQNGVVMINGANNNVNPGKYSFIRITGPTAAFNITGFSGGFDGKILTIYNSTSQNMTISNLSAGSLAVNRINTLNGADVVTTGVATVTLQYSSADNRWIVIAVRD